MKIMQSMGRSLSGLAARYMPDPMIFAIGLTFITFLLGLGLTDNSPMQMIIHWYGGFWSLLTFAMQMALILVTGYALAVAPGLREGIRWLARLPKTGPQAVFTTALVATIFTWFHWGLGLIVAALFALTVGREAHKAGRKVHYPLLGAAAYSGQMVWHLGPSTSAGLLSATPGHFLEKLIGIVPITQTSFSLYALLLSAVLVLLVVPFTMWAMTPKDSEAVGLARYAPDKLEGGDIPGEESSKRKRGSQTAADWLENSRLVAWVLAVMGIVYTVYYFSTKGLDLNLNIFNFAFLMVGLALHGSVVRYIRAVQQAAVGAAGIILQFPFYGGIAGMIGASGLATIMAGGLLALSTPESFPVIAWLTAGVVNLFVPSGGGEWAVIGEIISRTAMALNVPIGKAIVAYGAGDMWTNMLQPFWAIPLLGIMGLRARDIMGYTVGLMIIAAPFIFIGLRFFPY